ncbi:MAG: hypothetical protein ACYC5Y_02000 [Symbiobacteriia bacterium]
MSGPKGNLVKNPGFELGLAFWEVPVTQTDLDIRNVDVRNGAEAHSGVAAAALGAYSTIDPAVLFQDVPVADRRFYELHFHVAGTAVAPNANLIVDVRWLDRHKNGLGPGLDIFVPAETIGYAGSGAWSPHGRLTGESPEHAAFARISFTRGGGSNELVLDDVSFADQS